MKETDRNIKDDVSDSQSITDQNTFCFQIYEQNLAYSLPTVEKECTYFMDFDLNQIIN